MLGCLEKDTIFSQMVVFSIHGILPWYKSKSMDGSWELFLGLMVAQPNRFFCAKEVTNSHSTKALIFNRNEIVSNGTVFFIAIETECIAWDAHTPNIRPPPGS